MIIIESILTYSKFFEMKYNIVVLCKRPNNSGNKGLKTVAIIGGITAGAILGPLAVVGAVGALGFGAVGVTAGSIAAGIQSAVYGGSVASGSIFAICQSIGAAGLGIAGTASSAAAGATVGGIFTGITTKIIGSNSNEVKISVSGLSKVSPNNLVGYINALILDSNKTIIIQLMDKSPFEVNSYSAILKTIDTFVDADTLDADKTAFKSVDVVFLFDETTDINDNYNIFKDFGKDLEQYAKKTVKVIIAGSKKYCEENCKTCRDFAPSIPKENFLTVILNS
ncbi:uncharacterized protein LOC111618390 [Centruroides sculpturatus]|uniref:uncharacterized protein LOC111618390 n=1 Tax=Centruroides sculpturatus TaxID=218467 RepID=UPI000C6D8E77|nr:uncharacterized protein LOC111618390 [Centruroides sculpturatus]